MPEARAWAVMVGGAALLMGTPVWLMGAVLFIGAETAQGRLVGLGLLSGVSLIVTVVRALFMRRWGEGALGVSVSLSLAIVMWARHDTVAMTTAAPSMTGTAVTSVFLAASDDEPRLSFVDWLPEIEQVRAGTYLAPLVDPFLDFPEAARLRGPALEAYRSMDQDPAWRAIPSTMSWVYANGDVGHVYVIVPKHSAEEKLPAIEFLHGSVGNFKMYLPFWKRFAEKHRVVIVAPSFGFGNWNQPKGVAAIRRARAYASQALPIDEKRVFLVGLSNGGLGVTRGGAADPTSYAGLVYFSGVVEPNLMRRELAPAWRGRRVAFIHGDLDDRIPFSLVEEAAASLKAAGVEATLLTRTGKDHYLFMEDNSVFDDLAAWMRSPMW